MVTMVTLMYRSNRSFNMNGPLCGAFERHFGPGNLNNNFQKSQMPGGLPGVGHVEASI